MYYQGREHERGGAHVCTIRVENMRGEGLNNVGRIKRWG